MRMSFRLGSYQDIPILETLWKQAQLEKAGLVRDPAFTSRHHQQYKDVFNGEMPGHIYLGYQNGQPVSFVWVNPELLDEQNTIGITELFSTGKKGVGAKTLSMAEDLYTSFLDEGAALTVQLDSVPSAVGFYQKQGYTQQGEGYMHLPMAKKLKKNNSPAWLNNQTNKPPKN
jgi:hypothetical protein